MRKRHRTPHTTILEQHLAELFDKAEYPLSGTADERVPREVPQGKAAPKSEAAVHLDKWLKSAGLKPPT
jgi:hypothetical protein